MSQQKPTVEIKPVASFGDVVKDVKWGADLRRAAEANSVGVVQPSEQPSPEPVASTPRPPRPR